MSIDDYQINEAREMLYAMMAHGTDEFEYLYLSGSPAKAAKAAVKYAEERNAKNEDETPFRHNYDLFKRFFQWLKTTDEYKSWVTENAARQAYHAAAVSLGSARTAKKAAAVRENGKFGGAPKGTARRWYAGHNPWGTGFVHEKGQGWRVFVFETKAAREAWLLENEYQDVNRVAEPISARIAARLSAPEDMIERK